MGEHMQIGEAAERTGLSLRTIRYYEEMGIVTPSARTQGGFRLYTEPDVDRLNLVARMKPLGFQLDEMRELLDLLYPGSSGATRAAGTAKARRARLWEICATTERRCAELRTKLELAEGFAATLRETLEQPAERSTRVS